MQASILKMMFFILVKEPKPETQPKIKTEDKKAVKLKDFSLGKLLCSTYQFLNLILSPSHKNDICILLALVIK